MEVVTQDRTVGADRHHEVSRAVRSVRYLSGPVEADWLLTACEDSLKPFVLTALQTGMWKEELFSLTWDLVDMAQGHIRPTQAKNGTARAVPFNETLWSLFSRLRTRQDVP